MEFLHGLMVKSHHFIIFKVVVSKDNIKMILNTGLVDFIGYMIVIGKEIGIMGICKD